MGIFFINHDIRILYQTTRGSIESKRVLVGGSGGFTEIQNKRFLLGLAEMIEIKIHLVGML